MTNTKPIEHEGPLKMVDGPTVMLERDMLHFQTISIDDLPIGSLCCSRDWKSWRIWWYDDNVRHLNLTFDEALEIISDHTGCAMIRSTVGIRN